MTFPFPGADSLAIQLARLVQSPRVRSTGNQLNRSLPYASGPLRSGSGSPVPPNRTGASQRFGQWHEGDSTGGAFQGIGGILSQLSGQVQQQNDPLTQLYAQLLDQLQSPVPQPTGIDTEGLMHQIQSALNPIYDQRAESAQGQSDRARADVKDMYRALSNDYERLAPQQEEQARQAQADVEQLYGQLRSNIEGSYSRVSKQQADEFKRLGIEDALPSVLEDQQAPVQDALTAASENQAQQKQRYMDIGNMDETFYREGSPIATMAGNEYSMDLLAQLGDYLKQNEAERTSGIQSAFLDQLGQAQNLLAQQQQNAGSETARRQEMLWQMLQSQLQGRNQQQQQELTPDTYMAQLAPQLQNSVAGAFTQLQRSPEAVYGKVEDPRNPVPGSFVETTPEWYLQQADKLFQSGQIDASTRQALLMYIQLYYGLGQQ